MKTKEQLLKMVSMKNQEKYQYLSEFFKYMPEIVVEDFRYIEVKKNEKIILGGEEAKYVYIILDGEVKGTDYYQTGSVYSFVDLSKMSIVGDFEAFSNIPEYIISIYANQDSKLLRISTSQYMKWIKYDENALYMRLNDVLKILTDERIMDRKFIRMDCKERVMHCLILHYEGNKKASSQKVTVSMTQAELSERVGFNIRSIQRAIAALESEGLITIENRKMVISQEQYLKLVNEMK